MKLFSKILIGSALGICFFPSYAFNDSFSVGGNLSFTTDYLVRGVTQTNEGPAVQGALRVNHESGLYAGMWASNLNFSEAPVEDRAHIEIDYSLGYAQQLPTGVSYGLEWTYYSYPDANSKFNYDSHEVSLNLGYVKANSALGFKYAYSPEAFGESGKAHYLELRLNQQLGQGIAFNVHAGHQIYSDDEKGAQDYTNYGVGLSYSIPKFFDVSINYADTDLDNLKSSTFFKISKDF